jgi:hypothetical protein
MHRSLQNSCHTVTVELRAPKYDEHMWVDNPLLKKCLSPH